MGAFHDDLSAAIERIRKAAVANGKRAGIYCVGGEAAKKYADQGFHMVWFLFRTLRLCANVSARSRWLPMPSLSRLSCLMPWRPPKAPRRMPRCPPTRRLMSSLHIVHIPACPIHNPLCMTVLGRVMYYWAVFSASSTRFSTSCSVHRWNSFFGSDRSVFSRPWTDWTCRTGTS